MIIMVTHEEFWKARAKSSEKMANDPKVYDEVREIARNRCTTSVEKLFKQYTI